MIEIGLFCVELNGVDVLARFRGTHTCAKGACLWSDLDFVELRRAGLGRRAQFFFSGDGRHHPPYPTVVHSIVFIEFKKTVVRGWLIMGREIKNSCYLLKEKI